ncbi:MAG: helix-turn-helix domain-containing protein [Clostridium sp.]|nr:helix-turn-helix domain-containing protein [Clostridium sp.]
MAVFRVAKNHNYTVMSNYHLRDTSLTLKAIGLLSKMLSLTDEWDYTTRGLAAICKEGVDAIGAALKELEASGYLVRRQLRDSRGRITDTEYIIYESPHTSLPDTALPYMENPDMDNPDMDEPYTEKPAQLNKDRRSKEKEILNESSTDLSNPDPINHPPSPLQDAGYGGMGYDEAREIVRENIDYDILIEDPKQDREQLDEVVDLIAETLCSRRQTIVIAGDEYPAEMVKQKLLRISASHIEYVFDCLKQNTTYVRNIKKYLLASLFNAPSTIGSYYSALVNHDMYGDGLRGSG